MRGAVSTINNGAINSPAKSCEILPGLPLRGYCWPGDAAVRPGLEALTGSLRAGLQADLVVLSDNLFDMPAHRIYSAQVDVTVVEGKRVYGDWPE